MFGFSDLGVCCQTLQLQFVSDWENSHVHVPLNELEGVVVVEGFELHMGAGDLRQQVVAFVVVGNGPDQNPVAENLQDGEF